MKKPSQLFSQSDRRHIADKIAAAESMTRGEIVPVVTTSSGRYDRGEDLFGLVFAVGLLTGVWLLFQDVQPLQGDWESGQTLVLGLGWVLLTLVVGFLIGTALATYFPILSVPFVPKEEMRQEVARAARAAFQELKINRTAEGTGILIYISLREHIVHVLGDESIATRLEQEQWQAVVDLVLQGLKQGQPAEGLGQAIERCGEILSEHFPRLPDDEDELVNELHLFD